ncbi:MAG: ABC transporter permease [Terracidiphilus sp.]|jgi:putative ABC transport system permease protein
MNKLIFANLLHRPVRSVISVLAVAIEVVMILSIVGIFMGMLNDQKQRTNGIGADVMVWPSNASAFNGVGAVSLPQIDADALRNLPHVIAVSPVIQHLTTNGNVEILFGIDYDTFNALKPFAFIEGGKFQGPNDVIVDSIIANDKLHVGQTINILDRPFRISGIVESGKGARKLVPLATMQEMIGTPRKVSLIYVKCDDPANADVVLKEIHSTPGFEQNTLMTIDSWLNEMTPSKIPGFNLALEVITSIAVIVGFLVIFQTMYTAVLERTREIGILKSMGASKFTIVAVLLRECSVLAIAGVIVGISLTYVVRSSLLHFFPTQHFEITAGWLLRGALIAFAGAIVGAIYPAWVAARKDPIEALAYE